MKKLQYLVCCSIFLSACISTNTSTNQGVQDVDSCIIQEYAKDGWVKKYYNGNKHLVYDIREADYYRTAYYSNEQINRDSVTVEYYMNGNKKFEGYLCHEFPDTLNNLCKWYYSSGKPEKEANYKSGEINGQVIEYYDIATNQIKQKYTIKNNEYNGEFTSYYEYGGQLKEQKQYKKGKLNGWHITYYSNGQIKEKRYLANDILNGSYHEYYENGNPHTIGYYYKDNKAGTWTYYDESGYFRQERQINVRVGARCCDGTRSYATGRGACSHHGGVDYWIMDNRWVVVNEGHK